MKTYRLKVVWFLKQYSPALELQARKRIEVYELVAFLPYTKLLLITGLKVVFFRVIFTGTVVVAHLERERKWLNSELSTIFAGVELSD